MPLILVIAIYVGAIVAANLSVATFGPWVSPINSFLLIGLDLSLRDRLHDAIASRTTFWPQMAGIILLAAGISYQLNPAAGAIAFASAVAFLVAGLVDAIIYHVLKARGATYMARVNGSNMGGALADSFIFPTLAFGAVLPAIIGLQFVAKMAGGFIWALVLRRLQIAGAR